MNIFVINSGSSSIKYQLFNMPATQPICGGLVERIGSNDAVITHKVFVDGEEKITTKKLSLKDHEAGLNEVNKLLTEPEIAVIKSPEEIEIVGHRVVHGGEAFKETTIITKEVKAKIRQLFSLAPLHNPANYTGIEVAEKIFTKAKQIAVFDTAFYQTMPEQAYRYAIAEKFYAENRIRAYGFHGTSHKYVSKIACEYLNKKDAKLISIHLGNGCSITAVANGKAIDTSMGFGPLNGLVMGTRSGDIDPSVIFHLIEHLDYSAQDVSDMLNKKSGLLGLTGYNDMRDISKAITEGDKNALLALNLYCYRIKKYIGSYAAILNGLDAIIFTAGVGENSALVRETVCTNLQYLGIAIDASKNKNSASTLREISDKAAAVKVLVIPTNEELEIVQQCYSLVNN